MSIKTAQEAYDNQLPSETVELSPSQERMIERVIDDSTDTGQMAYDIALSLSVECGKRLTEQQIQSLDADIHDAIAKALEVFLCT